MQTPSRLRKAEEIIELAMMFQNSYCGLCIDDIREHFECSRRSAERMKAVLFDMFPEKIEVLFCAKGLLIFFIKFFLFFGLYNF